MTYIPIPLDVLDAPGYAALTHAEQRFLLDLYVLFHDCERFTIDMYKPQQYRQSKGVFLGRKVRALINAGLLQIVGMIGRPDHRRRVFAFTYPAFEAVVLQQEKEAA